MILDLLLLPQPFDELDMLIEGIEAKQRGS